MANTLYSFRRCPYAIRARMTLKYSGVNVNIHEVDLKNKPESLLKKSPKGTVPVLLIDNKKVIDESRDIMAFALSLNDPNGWLSKDDQVISETEELIKINDASFKENLDKYKYATKYPDESQENYRSQGEEFLKALEKKLNQHDYLFGKNISYGDIAIFPFIRQFAHVDKAWFDQAPYPKLQKWLNEFLRSKLFNDVMIKDLTNI